MNNNTVMRVLTFMNQVNEGVFGDSESNKKEIIEFLSSVPDFGDFARRHKISPLALCIGLISILLNDKKMTKDLKDNKEDSLFEILKKTNKEFMN